MAYLTCACCGGLAERARQYWNQDKGFSLCVSCGDWILSRGETIEQVEFSYGKRGVYWDRKTKAEESAAIHVGEGI